MNHPGDLNQRITVQTPGTTEDALGQRVPGWSDVCTVWADVRHPSGLQQVRGDAVLTRVRTSIRVHLRSDITPAMRVVHGVAVYDIKAVLPDHKTRLYMDLVCEAAS